MATYNNDEFAVPLWLNKQFILNILNEIEKMHDAVFEIINLNIRPATQLGDHYASIMFRVIINYIDTLTKIQYNKTVILKTVPAANTKKAKNLNGTHIFENELKVYTEIIPKFEVIWQKFGENIKFSGRLLYATLSPHPVIVLEDLCLSGYDILRERLFNLNEVKLCLSKLAKWHAVSYKMTIDDYNIEVAGDVVAPTQQALYYQQQYKNAHTSKMADINSNNTNTNTSYCTNNNNDNNSSSSNSVRMNMMSQWQKLKQQKRASSSQCNVVTQMQFGLFKMENLIRSDYLSGGMHSMITALKEMGGFEPYLTKLRAMAPHLIERCVAMNDAFANGITGPIYVLNHGDFHTKNIMIRKIAKNCNNNDVCGKIDDILFIDFQMTFYGPVSYDLIYLSFTLLSRQLRDEQRDVLLRYYYECFIENLKLLNCKTTKIPTYEALEAERKQFHQFEIFMVSTFLCLTKLSNVADNEVVDINLIFTSKEYRAKFYKNPNFIAYLRELLPWYLENEFLD